MLRQPLGSTTGIAMTFLLGQSLRLHVPSLRLCVPGGGSKSVRNNEVNLKIPEEETWLWEEETGTPSRREVQKRD